MNLVAALLAIGVPRPGRWSLDNAIDFAPHGWWALVIAVVVGVGGAAALLVDVLAPARARSPPRRSSGARGAELLDEQREHLAPVADDADVGRVEDRCASASGLIASTVPRGAQADGVVELAARADAHEQARRDRPAGDADLARAGEPALVGDLAGRAELGAEQRRAAVRARRTRRAATPVPTPMTVCASASTSRSSSRVRASTRTRPRAGESAIVSTARASTARRCERREHARRARSPSGRGDVQWIAATSWPPNAGFHATSRSSSRSSSTASPVRPAPRRAATRDATSRPHAVEPVRIAHGCRVARELGDRARRRLPRRSRRRGARSRRRPTRAASRSSGGSTVTASTLPRERGGRAEELAGRRARGRVRRRRSTRGRRRGAARRRPASRGVGGRARRARRVRASSAHGVAHLVGERRVGPALPRARRRPSP